MWHKISKASHTFFFLLFSFIVILLIGTGTVLAVEKAYYHFVILGDPHLPGKYINSKEHVIQDINTWVDVDGVVAMGDICEISGTVGEYVIAKNFFKSLNKSLFPIVGNHDYIYDDRLSTTGHHKKAAQSTRAAKLLRFQETFDLTEIYYTKRAGNYLMVFLSTDNLSSDNLTEMSARELEWLRTELNKNNKVPTIIFFHAPLIGTLRNYNSKINTSTRIAQPSDKIHALLLSNPQVFLWVSGHTHTPPTEQSFASPINVYDTHVTNIHNTDMNRETIYTNSLYLYPDKVVIRTYNHKKGIWLPEFDRTIAVPAL